MSSSNNNSIKIDMKGKNNQGFAITRSNEELGKGAFGTVYRGFLPTSSGSIPCAVKEVFLKEGDRTLQRFQSVGSILLGLNHPYLTRIYGASVRHLTAGEKEILEHQDKKGVFVLALEYASGGDLAGKIESEKSIAPLEAVMLMQKIVEGVTELHSHKIIHRDLKPENILLDEKGNPKICDFGMVKDESAQMGITQTGALTGTIKYMSPEQIRSEKILGSSPDIYALGCILYEMLAGKSLMPENKGNMEMITIGVSPSDRWRENSIGQLANVPRDLKSLIGDMVNFNGAQRPGLDEISTKLQKIEKNLERLKSSGEMETMNQGPSRIPQKPGGFKKMTADSTMVSAYKRSGLRNGEKNARTSHRRTREERKSNIGAWITGAIAMGLAIGTVLFTAYGSNPKEVVKGDNRKTAEVNPVEKKKEEKIQSDTKVIDFSEKNVKGYIGGDLPYKRFIIKESKEADRNDRLIDKLLRGQRSGITSEDLLGNGDLLLFNMRGMASPPKYSEEGGKIIITLTYRNPDEGKDHTKIIEIEGQHVPETIMFVHGNGNIKVPNSAVLNSGDKIDIKTALEMAWMEQQHLKHNPELPITPHIQTVINWASDLNYVEMPRSGAEILAKFSHLVPDSWKDKSDRLVDRLSVDVPGGRGLNQWQQFTILHSMGYPVEAHQNGMLGNILKSEEVFLEGMKFSNEEFLQEFNRRTESLGKQLGAEFGKMSLPKEEEKTLFVLTKNHSVAIIPPEIRKNLEIFTAGKMPHVDLSETLNLLEQSQKQNHSNAMSSEQGLDGIKKLQEGYTIVMDSGMAAKIQNSTTDGTIRILNGVKPMTITLNDANKVVQGVVANYDKAGILDVSGNSRTLHDRGVVSAEKFVSKVLEANAPLAGVGTGFGESRIANMSEVRDARYLDKIKTKPQENAVCFVDNGKSTSFKTEKNKRGTNNFQETVEDMKRAGLTMEKIEQSKGR